MNTHCLSIAVGVIRNLRGQLLISQRGQQVDQAGLWEFPGGKIESGETAEQGLRRELLEELGITVTQTRRFLQIRHSYPNYTVELQVFLVYAFSGDAQGLEGQPIRWITATQLNDYRFPAANLPILRKLQLSEYYPILEASSDTELWANLTAILSWQPQYLHIRLKNLPRTQRVAVLPELIRQCASNQINILLNSSSYASVELTDSLGWHLTAADLLLCRQLPITEGYIAASCHHWSELQQAQNLGVDFAVLSPVLMTASHVEAHPLGWEQFAEGAAAVNFPVYALGGLSLTQLSTAKHYGAQGVSGIRAFLAGTETK